MALNLDRARLIDRTGRVRMKDLTQRFLRPANPVHRQYEALRAHFVDDLSMREAADRFGYQFGTFRNLCTAFRK